MSPRAIASTTEVGKQVQEDVPGVLLVLRHRRSGAGVGADRHREPRAGLEDVDEREPEEQRDRRRDLEVDDRLQADAPHRLQVAGAGDADDQRREEQRRDDHLDHPQEGVGQRLDGDAEAGPEVADEDAEQRGR